VFKKTFFLLDYAVQEIEKQLQENALKKEDITSLKDNFLKHVALSIFLLQGHQKKSIQETNVLFYILSLLDAVGDLLFRAAGYLVVGKKDNEEHEFFKRIACFLHKIYLSFFSQESYQNVYRLRETMYPARPERTPNMMILSVIAKLLLELVESRITLLLFENQRA